MQEVLNNRPNMTIQFNIKQVTWQQALDQAQLKAVREVVFVQEQHVPLTIEWDNEDADAIHLLALDENENAIGCARVLKHGRIGRMAVMPSWRGKGLGWALLKEAIAVCRQLGMLQVAISSQTHAIKFYQNAGFVVTSDAYIDANIWHVDMVLDLSV